MKIKATLTRIFYSIKYHKRRIRLYQGAYIGRNTIFEGNNTIYRDAFFSGNIGFASNIGSNSYILGTIGRFCSIGERVCVISLTHPAKTFVSTHPAFYSTLGQSGFSFVNVQKFDEKIKNINGEPLTVGNDVWIGSNAVIMAGVTIGDGAIIGAGSLVTHDVKPYSIVVGIPAKMIRYRFSKEQIDFLLHFRWWDKDIEWLRQNAEYFDNIETFINRYGKTNNDHAEDV